MGRNQAVRANRFLLLRTRDSKGGVRRGVHLPSSELPNLAGKLG